MTFKVIREQANIIVLGHFNPAIFHPMWFAKHDLLPPSEAEAAKLEITHPELAQFQAGWLTVSVQPGRFLAQTEDPSMEMPLRDLVLGTFSVLEHTPLTSMGINRLTWAQIDDEARWHELGHVLAPKSPWADLMADPRTSRVEVTSTRGDALPGRVLMRFEAVPELARGVLLNINHDIRQESAAITDGALLMRHLNVHFERLQNESRQSLQRLVSAAIGEQA